LSHDSDRCGQTCLGRCDGDAGLLAAAGADIVVTTLDDVDTAALAAGAADDAEDIGVR
jgi:hypothetical protein